MVDTTLTEFLYTIPTEPEQEIGPSNPPLRTFMVPPTANQLEGFPYAPYAIIVEAPGNVETAFFGGSDEMTRLITVSLHQAPGPGGVTPTRWQMSRLITEINKAPHFVDEDLAVGTFISLERLSEYPASYDAETKGLFAAVRFRQRYMRH